MNQRQQEMRHAAARAFIESLDQLHETLQSPANDSPPPELNGQLASNSNNSFDLNSFEQAVADIEEFIENQQTGRGESI